MYIHEITTGSRISLQAYGENGSASLQSEVFQTGKNEIYVELFEHGDIRVGFESKSIHYDLLLIRDSEVPLSWPNVKIGKVEIEGKLYHSIYSKDIAGKIPEGTVIQISFQDPELHERVELQSRIVRHEELDKQILYGGILTRSYPSLDRYIARKQLRNGVNRKR